MRRRILVHILTYYYKKKPFQTNLENNSVRNLKRSPIVSLLFVSRFYTALVCMTTQNRRISIDFNKIKINNKYITYYNTIAPLGRRNRLVQIQHTL